MRMVTSFKTIMEHENQEDIIQAILVDLKQIIIIMTALLWILQILAIGLQESLFIEVHPQLQRIPKHEQRELLLGKYLISEIILLSINMLLIIDMDKSVIRSIHKM